MSGWRGLRGLAGLGRGRSGSVGRVVHVHAGQDAALLRGRGVVDAVAQAPRLERCQVVAKLSALSRLVPQPFSLSATLMH